MKIHISEPGRGGGSLTIFRVSWSCIWCASATDVFLGKWRNELMHRENPDQKIFIFHRENLLLVPPTRLRAEWWISLRVSLTNWSRADSASGPKLDFSGGSLLTCFGVTFWSILGSLCGTLWNHFLGHFGATFWIPGISQNWAYEKFDLNFYFCVNKTKT